jgi:hypothetical protein
MALVGSQPGTPPSAPATEAKDTGDFKAKKRAAADRHAQKVKEARQTEHERMLSLRDTLTKNGQFNTLSQEDRDYITSKCVPPTKRVRHTGPSFFTQVFGDKPAVGAVVTLRDVIAKTYKGMNTMQASIKKWQTKGIEVKVEINTQDKLATKYTITKLPDTA